jgi:hypothetical protein
MCERALSLLKLNKSTQRSMLNNENVASAIPETIGSITPDLKFLASTVNTRRFYEWSFIVIFYV